MTIEDIWPQYRGSLRAFLGARVSNPEDAEDLLQEISIKVFTGLPALEHSAKLKSWLFSDRPARDHRPLPQKRPRQIRPPRRPVVCRRGS